MAEKNKSKFLSLGRLQIFWSLASNRMLLYMRLLGAKYPTLPFSACFAPILESRADNFKSCRCTGLLLDARVSIVRFTVATEAGVMLLGKAHRFEINLI